MECSLNITGTLRAQEHGHQPWSMRTTALTPYTGPHQVVAPPCPHGTVQAETMSRWWSRNRYSASPAMLLTGNLKTVATGSDIKQDLAYTLDRHRPPCRVQQAASRHFQGWRGNKHSKAHVSTRMPRILVLQGTDQPRLIRRLTPLECERLQGFPDGWTDIPNASDSSRYKALGNSVAIPCVDYVLFGIALVLLAG